MSIVFSPSPESLKPATKVGPTLGGRYRRQRRPQGIRRLTSLVLAAVVAGWVLVADRFISTWADEHLFWTWMGLWGVVFVATALFAQPAHQLARRAVRTLDHWASQQAQARASARLSARAGERKGLAEDPNDFHAALAPLGLPGGPVAAESTGWAAYVERAARGRARNSHLHYI